MAELFLNRDQNCQTDWYPLFVEPFPRGEGQKRLRKTQDRARERGKIPQGGHTHGTLRKKRQMVPGSERVVVGRDRPTDDGRTLRQEWQVVPRTEGVARRTLRAQGERSTPERPLVAASFIH